MQVAVVESQKVITDDDDDDDEEEEEEEEDEVTTGDKYEEDVPRGKIGRSSLLLKNSPLFQLSGARAVITAPSSAAANTAIPMPRRISA